ncbi:MAG: RNA methyltransferase [Chryseobacterium sp.]|nr:MAG: RNA methyltransferase [Chryseobacterium sp.]
MLTAHKIKLMQSLDKRKYRQKYNMFLVEGNKTINELPASPVTVVEVFSTDPSLLFLPTITVTQISAAELRKISFLQHPKDSVALCRLPDEPGAADSPRRLILDGIQDPGNLGTLIRLADWFGMEEIICSPDTVDVYNPKVIQATMGSFARVRVIYAELEAFLSNVERAVFATDMLGDDIYDIDFPTSFDLILGNEGNGISAAVRNKADRVVTIPRFGDKQSTESLNVAMAAGIILGQAYRKS